MGRDGPDVGMGSDGSAGKKVGWDTGLGSGDEGGSTSRSRRGGQSSN